MKLTTFNSKNLVEKVIELKGSPVTVQVEI